MRLSAILNFSLLVMIISASTKANSSVKKGKYDKNFEELELSIRIKKDPDEALKILASIEDKINKEARPEAWDTASVVFYRAWDTASVVFYRAWAVFLYETNDAYEKSEKLFIDALYRLSSINSIDNKVRARMALIHNNLGCLYINLSRLDFAEQELTLALSIFNGHFGTLSVDTATTLNNLGTLYRTKKDYEKSVYFYTQAIGILEILAKADPNIRIGTVYKNIGLTLKEQGMDELASKNLNHAKKLYEKLGLKADDIPIKRVDEILGISVIANPPGLKAY